MASEQEPPSLEERKFALDAEIRRREAALKEVVSNRRGLSAAQATIAGAAIALVSGVAGALITAWSSQNVEAGKSLTLLQIEKLKAEGNLELERTKQTAVESLERKKFETSLILDAIKTTSRAESIRNLKFFVAAGFVSDPERRIINLDDSALPSLNPPSICLKPGEKIVAWSCDQTNGTHVVVNIPATNELNVRTTPNVQGLLTASLPSNATDIVVDQCSAGWCAIQCRNVKGWVSNWYLALRSKASRPVTNFSRTGEGLIVRNGPDQACSAVGFIPPNDDDVVLHYCEGNATDSPTWCLISSSQSSGWVFRRASHAPD
ncbi:MAG: hypothetical protein JO328_02865 [Hyphomicrobiales bacterium]|nr:hypothetical protein [Hyphomicrobiales bacterium]MBV8825991.1 hypothetical protein [Hyphomicrobiales bacterium]MBV9428522.1 hypothetical protein [Bradyrhizobiaceae bacterium]